MFGSISAKKKSTPTDPVEKAIISRCLEKKPAIAVYAVVMLFNFFLTLSYIIDNSKSLDNYFKSLPVFGFSLVTQGLLAATLTVMYLGARIFPESAALAKVKDALLLSTTGIAAAEATYYVAFLRKNYISCGYTPRHSAFLAIVEVLGLAAVLISLAYGKDSPKVLLFSIILCPFACLLRLIPSFVYVRDFLRAKLEVLDMTKEDFLTPFFDSLNDPLFHLQLVKILVCLLLAGFAGSVYYYFMGTKKNNATENDKN